MQNHESAQTIGFLKISKDVIATIARSTALEVEGVASLAPFGINLKGLLMKKPTTKAVSIDLTDDLATIDIFIYVKSGFKIPDVSEKIQMSVKEAVQNMTGITVSRVNITIAGIIFDETSQTVPDDQD